MKRWSVARFIRAFIPAMLLLASGVSHAQSADPFPESNQVTGWHKGEVRYFDAAHLHEYINGGAEVYIKAGVVGTATADYTYRDGGDAVADVYTMNDARGAQTIFDADSAGQAQPVKLGDAAYSSGQTLLFRQGPYLVRLVAFQEKPETRQALVDLGKAIAARLE